MTKTQSDTLFALAERLANLAEEHGLSEVAVTPDGGVRLCRGGPLPVPTVAAEAEEEPCTHPAQAVYFGQCQICGVAVTEGTTDEN